MVRQATQQIEGETDVIKLQQMAAQLQQMSSQAPAEAKPAFDLILKRAGERLQVLSGEKK
jgi:hypothetical protein